MHSLAADLEEALGEMLKDVSGERLLAERVVEVATQLDRIEDKLDWLIDETSTADDWAYELAPEPRKQEARLMPCKCIEHVVEALRQAAVNASGTGDTAVRRALFHAASLIEDASAHKQEEP